MDRNTIEYLASWLVAGALAGAGYVTARGVTDFGLPSQAAAWLGLITILLGVAQLALPKVIGPGSALPAALKGDSPPPPHG